MMGPKRSEKLHAVSFAPALLWLWTTFLISVCPGAAEPTPGEPVQRGAGSISDSTPRYHLRVLDLESSARFNYVDQEGGGVLDRGIQYRLRIRTRFDLPGKGSTYLLVRAETGRGFNNSWNETAADLNPGQTIFNVKSIAIVQKLGTHAEVSAGGLDFDHGTGGDEIYVSHDGYMTGYRALLSDAAPWLPKRVSVTAAFVGDFDKPNVFSRFRMDRANYIQVLAQLEITSRLEGSAELDAIEGAHYNREAILCRHVGPVDEVVVEVVLRGSDRVTFAWSSELHRSWGPKWHTDLFYSDLPERMYLVSGRQVLPNRGEIGLGKRRAGDISHKLSEDFAVSVFAGRLLDNSPNQRWVAQAGVSYQFAPLFNRMRR